METECNGLLTYDRAVEKVDVKQVAEAHRGRIAPPPTFVAVAPTAEKEPVLWRYTVKRPAADWLEPGFDDTKWKEGPAVFGMGSPTNGAARTAWDTDDLWLRRQVVLAEGELRNLALKVFNEADVEIYLNGVLAARLPPRNSGYEELDLMSEAERNLKAGPNLIAVRCHQEKPGHSVDVRLVRQVQR